MSQHRRRRSPSIPLESPAPSKKVHIGVPPTSSQASKQTAGVLKLSPAGTSTSPVITADSLDRRLYLESHPELQVGPREIPSVLNRLPAPAWCQCGECEANTDTRVKSEVALKGESVEQNTVASGDKHLLPPKQYCCMSVVDNLQRRELLTGRVCQAIEYIRLIQDGPSASEYDTAQKVFTRTPAPPTFAHCDNQQKRLVIYHLVYNLLKEAHGWEALPEVKKQVRKPMPECLQLALRRRWPKT